MKKLQISCSILRKRQKANPATNSGPTLADPQLLYIQSYYLKNSRLSRPLDGMATSSRNSQTWSLAALAAVLGLADSGLVPLALLLLLKHLIKLLKALVQ